MRRCNNANEAIRKKIADCHLKHADIAEKLGITPNSFSRLLSRELRDGRRFEILKAIRELAREKAEHLVYAFEGVTADELFEGMWGDGDE